MKDLTPEHLQCPVGECLAVYELPDGRLLIIGKKPSPELLARVEGRVGPDEHAIAINRALLANVK